MVPALVRRVNARTSLPPVVTADLTCRFGDSTAVDGVTLEVPAGTILGVIGPSGSGKTTLVRMLTGTLEPSSGSARVLGETPRRFHRRTRERIGYMPHLFVLYPDLTAAENVAFVASLFGLLWRRRRRRVREVLEFVELWDARNRRAKDLSGGMQRRLELACALVHEPSLLFLDEPTAGLDPVLRNTIWEEFRRLRDSGATLVVTTQYVGEAEYCDQVAVLAEGQLVALEEPEELRRLAVGGEMIEIETQRSFDPEIIRAVPGVTAVRHQGPTKVLVVADDAGAATPRILEALQRQAVEVVSSSEYRPSFDEVFAELIERQRSTIHEEREKDGRVNGALPRAA
jgi:ABC-2 type transport system ATP-binding protein